MGFLKYLAPLLFVFSPLALHAANQYPLSLHLHVMKMTEASAPTIIDGTVLFTYPPDAGIRYVDIAFSNEDFAEVHTLVRNPNGVFFYVYPITPGQTELVYRLIVDGLWTYDPSNPEIRYDSRGIPLSVALIPPSTAPITSSPVINRDGTVQFYLHGPANRDITISGDFNHWDPFGTRLTEIKPGLYSVTLRVAPGLHAYTFISDGTVLSDPLNPRVDYSTDGSRVSVFSVP